MFNECVKQRAGADVGQDNRIESAILQAVAYADIFDYPLTAREIHHYLVLVPASRDKVGAALDTGRPVSGRLSRQQDYFTLPGREAIVSTRNRREENAIRMWPRAMRYGRLIGAMPFVRMLALTGALAVNNVEPDDDIDYLIVTEPGRLWLCRALIILLVKLAVRWGDVICPNYFLSEDALVLRERNLFTAHEMVQMVPLAGMAIYQRMRKLNGWVHSFLPNANGPLRGSAVSPPPLRLLRASAEAVLRTGPGDRLEGWEMDRKIARFSRQGREGGEVAFCADWCKGHFDHHGRHTLEAFTQRLRSLGLDHVWNMPERRAA